MNRFLQYSLERGRKIRMMLLLEGKLCQRTVLVLSAEGENVVLKIGTRKEPCTVPVADILSCDYARGDDGDV